MCGQYARTDDTANTSQSHKEKRKHGYPHNAGNDGMTDMPEMHITSLVCSYTVIWQQDLTTILLILYDLTKYSRQT